MGNSSLITSIQIAKKHGDGTSSERIIRLNQIVQNWYNKNKMILKEGIQAGIAGKSMEGYTPYNVWVTVSDLAPQVSVEQLEVEGRKLLRFSTTWSWEKLYADLASDSILGSWADPQITAGPVHFAIVDDFLLPSLTDGLQGLLPSRPSPSVTANIESVELDCNWVMPILNSLMCGVMNLLMLVVLGGDGITVTEELEEPLKKVLSELRGEIASELKNGFGTPEVQVVPGPPARPGSRLAPTTWSPQTAAGNMLVFTFDRQRASSSEELGWTRLDAATLKVYDARKKSVLGSAELATDQVRFAALPIVLTLYSTLVERLTLALEQRGIRSPSVSTPRGSLLVMDMDPLQSEDSMSFRLLQDDQSMEVSGVAEDGTPMDATCRVDAEIYLELKLPGQGRRSWSAQVSSCGVYAEAQGSTGNETLIQAVVASLARDGLFVDAGDSSSALGVKLTELANALVGMWFEPLRAALARQSSLSPVISLGACCA